MSVINNIGKELLYKGLPKKKYLKVIYRYYHNKNLDLNSPKNFSEKLFWLKLYNQEYCSDLIQKCYDKYTVRKYITDRVGEEFLPKLYGVYDNAEEIDFDSFPDKYVLKVTQSCGYNIINNGNYSIDRNTIKDTLNNWLKDTNDLKKVEKKYKEESYYFNGHAKIICEEYLEDRYGNGCMDYDFYCFNGEVKMYDCFFDFINPETGEKNDEKTISRNMYQVDHKFIPVTMGRQNNPNRETPQLENFNQMINIAEKLSQDFPFLRVDLYNVDGRIVVGELTMIPMGGAGKILPSEYDELWGDWLKLPETKI